MYAINKSRCSQRGVITLVVSMAILVLSTLVVFGVSDAIQMEQKITNNEARAKQAFEVAEAGMALAMSYLKNDPDVDSNNVIDPVFDTNANGVGDTNITMIGTGRVEISRAVESRPERAARIGRGEPDAQRARALAERRVDEVDARGEGRATRGGEIEPDDRTLAYRRDARLWHFGQHPHTSQVGNRQQGG